MSKIIQLEKELTEECRKTQLLRVENRDLISENERLKERIIILEKQLLKVQEEEGKNNEAKIRLDEYLETEERHRWTREGRTWGE